jgi:Regulator of ribonuclease activity B
MVAEYIPDDDTGAALRRWEAEGSDLSKAMVIDFFVAGSSQQACVDFSHAAELSEFSVSSEVDSETGTWTCYCSKRMLPVYEALVETEQLLDSVASRFGLKFDGFGSFGNSTESI